MCDVCGKDQRPGGVVRGVLEVILDWLPDEWPEAPPWSAEFLDAFLPIAGPENLPRLRVGGTPLLPVPELRNQLHMPHLWVKDDTRNPSGSTKDRASLLVVTKAIEYGIDTVATASTGNAATALAAVAAAAGMRAVVFVPASAPRAKLVQMLAYGAQVLPVDGTYDDAFELCLAACNQFGWYNRNTALNPFTIEGKKTVALEICAELAPGCVDAVIVPTGDGVIISGAAKGFADIVDAGLSPRHPRLIAVQPDGSPGITRALDAGEDSVRPTPGASSVADSLTVEVPRNALMALKRIRASEGGGVTVSDATISQAITRLARTTGVFAEPAAAAALAGLEVALERELVDPDERVVLLVTGSGLKDIPAAERSIEMPEPIAPELDAIAERLGE